MKRSRALALFAAGIAAVGVAAVTLPYRRDLRVARERVESGSRVADTRCGPIEYAVAGDGPPVLVVHCAGGGFDQGMDIAEPLAKRGLRVIAVSRFGYLRTPFPRDASAAAQADAHACLLDALGIREAAILGASAGAPSSLQFAIRHPARCRALILLVPAAYVPRTGGERSLDTPEWTRFFFDTALRSDFLFWIAPRVARDVVLRGIVATPPEVVRTASAGEQARVQMMLEHILPVSRRREGLLNDAAVTSSLTRYPLERIAAPTLVVSAADDLFGTYAPARYTAEQIPGGRFIGFPTGGHLTVGHDAEILDEVVRFIDAHPGP